MINTEDYPGIEKIKERLSKLTRNLKLSSKYPTDDDLSEAYHKIRITYLERMANHLGLLNPATRKNVLVTLSEEYMSSNPPPLEDLILANRYRIETDTLIHHRNARYQRVLNFWTKVGDPDGALEFFQKTNNRYAIALIYRDRLKA